MKTFLFIVLLISSFSIFAQNPKIINDKLGKEKKLLIRIPIDFGDRIESGTKLVLHDSGLNSISFMSHIVAIKQSNKGGFDTSSFWKIELTGNNLLIKSSKNNGFVKSYKVLNSHYNTELRMQEFDLGDNTGKKTNAIDISYSNTNQKYIVIISSVDNTEEYQFNIDEGNTETHTNSESASTKISAIQAKLFYNEKKSPKQSNDVSGTFSVNIIDDLKFSLWNTIIGEGSAEGYSNQTIVIIEIISNGMSNKNQF